MKIMKVGSQWFRRRGRRGRGRRRRRKV